VYTAPEGDASIAVVSVNASSARGAVDAAWRLYGSAAKPPIRALASQASHNGWDETQAVTYDLDPAETRVVQTVAFRKDEAWTILLIDGTRATLEKRGAAVALVAQSLRAPGYVRETFAGRQPRSFDAVRVEALRQFVSDGMAELAIPGAGLAIYDHGKVVFEGGVGRRRIDDPAPVDVHTRFMIASNTKQMTTMLLAGLVDEDKLRWEEPVTESYPAFRLGDAATTARVRIGDLLCACTGVPRKDLEVAFATRRDTPPTQTFELLAATRPTSRFGEVFQYSNVMAAAAGYVAAHVAYPRLELGAGYDRAMRERIFTPIGMADTSFDYDMVLRGNHATPHGWDFAGRQRAGDPTLEYAVRPGRPAGGAWSSVHDMIRYAAVELNEGRLSDGKQLVSRANVLARRAPSVALSEDGHYGMGLIVDRTSGVAVVHHGGALPGFYSDVIIIPEAGVAAVLLTNADSGALLLRPFLRRVLELVYDGKPEAQADLNAAAIRDRADRQGRRAALLLPIPAEARDLLSARYVSAELGEIRVTSDAQGILFNFGLWKSHVAAQRTANGGYAFVPIDPLALPVPFVSENRDGRNVLILRDGQHEYVYTPAG
jgi:CubicO group peptidase (beta-lactamase class C family)